MSRPKKSSKPTRTDSEKSSFLSKLTNPWFIAVVIVIAAVSWQFRSFWDSPSCLSPFKAPLLKESEIFDAAYQKEMFWGTYRPGLYLGLRTRSPSGLMGGLTWTGASEINYIHQIRHDAQQEDIQYQWDVHNGRDFGIQSIYDKELDINFTTTWIQQATDWTLRISTSSSRSKPVSFFFYIADEASSYERRDWDLMDAFVAPNGNWMFSGKHSEIREWQLGLHSPQLKQLKIYRAGYPVEHYHNLTEFMKHVLHDSIGFQYYMQTTKNKEALELRLHDPPAWMESSTEQPNFAILQIIGTPPFSFDLAFLNEDLSDEHFPSLVGSNLDVLIAKRKKEFEERFQKTFKKAGMEEKERLTMQGALSNLLGGMGYFYGNSRVRFPSKDGLFKIKDRFKAALFTSVPSRSFFPRGFLWDEGFHLLLIHKWDPLIAMDVLAHWLDLISRDGWIPREQILGEEARSRVPSEFVTQDPSVGNPPTFFLVLLEMADRPNDVTKAFLKQAWPRLKIWFLWMIENHRGSKEGTFRWTSREVSEEKLNPLTLDSGLDDFPRASHPDPQEYHLDLRCWIALAAKAMKTIGKTLQLPENELELYQNLTTTLTDMEELKKLHYDPEWGWFLDFGFHSENVVLEGRTVLTSNGEKERSFRKVETAPHFRSVPHFGYVSLFPFFLKMFSPEDPLLLHQLEAIKNPDLLWSEFGLRSLAKNSSLYQTHNTEHDPPYWRGAIWIHMNYLALEALKHYSQSGLYASLAAELHQSLRNRVVNNVVEQYHRTGFLWEQYDDTTGEGKGCRPFTGWTSLILFM